MYLGCNLNHYFTGPAADAKQRQLEGKVGELVYCIHKVGFNGTQNAYNKMTAQQWQTPYSHLKAFGAHPFSVMRYFCGDIVGIQAFLDKPGVRRTAEDSKGFTLPGWEPERLALLETTLKQYEGITADMLRENYKYFLERGWEKKDEAESDEADNKNGSKLEELNREGESFTDFIARILERKITEEEREMLFAKKPFETGSVSEKTEEEDQGK